MAYSESWNGETTSSSSNAKNGTSQTSASTRSNALDSTNRRNQRRARRKERRQERLSKQRTSSQQRNENRREHQQRFQTMTLEEKKQDTHATADRCLETLAHTEEVGADTAQKLHDQEKQLENINNVLSDIDHQQNRADDSLNRMNGYSGWFYNMFYGRPEVPETTTLKQDIAEKQKQTTTVPRSRVHNQSTRTTSTSSQDDPELLMKANQILAGLRRVRQNAEDCGDALDRQNLMLDELDTKMDRTNLRTKQLTEKANNIAKHGYS